MNESDLKKGDHIYFMGIGGTGMAAVAGLCQEVGLKVSGSDQKLYPPTSTMLEELEIDVKSPYAPENIPGDAKMVVVANVLSRGNVEIEKVLNERLPHTSFAKLLGERFLSTRLPVVITGTHGKTTTCSLAAHVLQSFGLEPGFFIGGLPRNFNRGFRLGQGEYFVVEGDEYDTAFFDKEPKFLHYKPNYLVLNNIEFDHADIYASLEAIKFQFAKLVELVSDKKRIIANIDDPTIVEILHEKNLFDSVTKVSTLGEHLDADFAVLSFSNSPVNNDLTKAVLKTPQGNIEIETPLSGAHNIGNILQVVALAHHIAKVENLMADFPKRLQQAMTTFLGVKRRLDLLMSQGGIDVYEDFAHHPTAMKMVIEGYRKRHPNRRLIVCTEWRSAIQRRNVMMEQYAQVLKGADKVFLGELFVDKRIPEDQRMNLKTLSTKIGAVAQLSDSNEDLVTKLKKEVKSGDAIIFMSSGSFSGVQYRFAKELLPTV